MAKDASGNVYTSDKAIAAAQIGKMNFVRKENEMKDPKALQRELEGWMSCLGVKNRTASIITKDAHQQIIDGALDGGKDYRSLPGVHTFSLGPYIDDWSQVPPEIAKKYNTSPTWEGEKPFAALYK